MNIANWLTLFRIVLIPLLLIFLSKNDLPEYQNYLGFLFFSIIFSTDYLDGLIARKFNMVTNLGKLLDPLADKIFVTSLLLFFVHTGQIAYYWVVLILIREFAVSGLRSIAALKNTVIKANIWGKVKTFWQFITLSWLILGFDHSNLFIYSMVIITVISGLIYFVTYRQLLTEESNNG